MQALSVILVRPRFSENIGMAARACANMGVSDLVLVEPRRWEREKALPLATPQGAAILDRLRIAPALADALAPCTHAFGATARTGGWRQGVLSPRQAATEVNAALKSSAQVALVFGPEDRGLENTEIELCTGLINIPTASGGSSLNLAQAVLLVLYECFTASLTHAFHPGKKPKSKAGSRPATIEEQEKLFLTLRNMLAGIGFFSSNNPDWLMLPLRRFFHRSGLRRHEFDLFMGMCRQMRLFADRPAKSPPPADE